MSRIWTFRHEFVCRPVELNATIAGQIKLKCSWKSRPRSWHNLPSEGPLCWLVVGRLSRCWLVVGRLPRCWLVVVGRWSRCWLAIGRWLRNPALDKDLILRYEAQVAALRLGVLPVVLSIIACMVIWLVSSITGMILRVLVLLVMRWRLLGPTAFAGRWAPPEGHVGHHTTIP